MRRIPGHAGEIYFGQNFVLYAYYLIRPDVILCYCKHHALRDKQVFPTVKSRLYAEVLVGHAEEGPVDLNHCE